MKVFGLALIMLASLVASGQVSAYYSRKISFSRILLDIITDIKSTAEYAPADIYSIFENYTQKRYSPFDSIFSDCSTGGEMFLDILSSGLRSVRELSDEVSETVISAFDSVSRSSREGAVNHLRLCESRLKEEIIRITDEAQTKGKMFEKLSPVMGLFLCIMLI